MKRANLGMIIFGSALVGSIVNFDDLLFDNIVGPVSAQVAGMDYLDLRRDRDFRRAVEYVIESYDFDSIVEDGIDSYDFESLVEDTVEDCVSQGVDQYIYC